MTYLNGKKARVIEDGGKFKKDEIIIISGNPYRMQGGKNPCSIIYAVNKDGMKQNIFYKDIYKQVKENVLIFAGLNGQTKVIEDQLF